MISARRWFVLHSVFLTLNLIAIVVARNSAHAEINVPLFFILPALFSISTFVTLTRQAGWYAVVAVVLSVALLSSSWLILNRDDGPGGFGSDCPRPKIHVRDC